MQDKVRAEKALLWRLIDRQGARVYVCSALVAPHVREAFVWVVSEGSGRSTEEARRYVDALFDSGRYLEDVWG